MTPDMSNHHTSQQAQSSKQEGTLCRRNYTDRSTERTKAGPGLCEFHLSIMIAFTNYSLTKTGRHSKIA